MRPALPPLVLHVVYRFDTGGLENGVVNLINHMPETAYRHGVVALTEVTDFRHRIARPDVACEALHKPPGHGVKAWPALYRILRRQRPAIVHTRNLAALEMQPLAWAAGVRVRIHGEHGRDAEDPDGASVRHQRIRRLYRPFVSGYVALSRDLERYLLEKIHVERDRVAQIYNGVDAVRFAPDAAAAAVHPFDRARHWVVGTVGRMLTVKNQPLLAEAFVRALQAAPDLRDRLRLVMVGEGPLRGPCIDILRSAGMADLAWLPGERTDVPDVMRSLNCFVLPSLTEGVSNTILEAMSSGLPVVAADVGGNAELVAAGRTGELVAAADPAALAAAIVRMVRDPSAAAAMGRAGRAEVERRFSLQAMVAAYQGLYDRLLGRAGVTSRID